MATLQELETWKAEAETALHGLMVGKRVVDVWVLDYGRTRFTEATRADLEAYIDRLARMIAAAQPNSTAGRQRGPIRLIPT